jgi:predicted nucleic acid-binding Zn ribbon protein
MKYCTICKKGIADKGHKYCDDCRKIGDARRKRTLR